MPKKGQVKLSFVFYSLGGICWVIAGGLVFVKKMSLATGLVILGSAFGYLGSLSK